MSPAFNAAADRNKEPIGDALEACLNTASTVLEIASGTGQHAVYLKQRFAHLDWQCTEQSVHMQNLNEVLTASTLAFPTPVSIEVSAAAEDATLFARLRHSSYSFMYSANTAHIMSIDQVASMFKLVGQLLDAQGQFALYGPFKINGEHTSDGNRDFDFSLRQQHAHMGIRDLQQVETQAAANQLVLKEDIPMPANNRVLIWCFKSS